MTARHCACPGCHRIVLDGADYCPVCIACDCERKRVAPDTVSDGDDEGRSNFLDASAARE